MKRFLVGWAYDEVGHDRDYLRVGVFTVLAEDEDEARAGAEAALPLRWSNREPPAPKAWAVREMADAGEYAIFRDGDEVRVTSIRGSLHVKTVKP